MTTEIHERLAQQETRLSMLEEGHRSIVSTLSEMKVEAAHSRGEQKQLLTDLSQQVGTLIRQADVAKGVEMEREKNAIVAARAAEAQATAAIRLTEQRSAWIRWGFPVAAVLALLGAIEWLEGAGFQRATPYEARQPE